MPWFTSRREFLRTSGYLGFGGVVASWGETPDADDTGSRKKLVVDSHVHLKHGDAAKTEYTAEVIVRVMDAVGIDLSIVFAMSTTTRRSIEMAREAVAQYPDRLIPYVYALPHYQRPVIKEIEEVLVGGLFKGIKIHAGECTLADYVIDPVLELAGHLRVPCLVDCLGNISAARRMATTFPGTWLIIAHMGRYLCTDPKLVDQFIGLAEECENVFLDLSGVVLGNKIEEAVRRIGSKRMIWGTDGPHPKPDLVSFAREELEKIRRLDIPEEDKDNLLGGTILGLLRIKPGKSA